MFETKESKNHSGKVTIKVILDKFISENTNKKHLYFPRVYE
jgi:hypothetical protein